MREHLAAHSLASRLRGQPGHRHRHGDDLPDRARSREPFEVALEHLRGGLDGDGLSALTASNCCGESISGTGLVATAATKSSGLSSSGVGLSAATASRSTAGSASDAACLSVTGTASYCRGTRSDAGIAISANIAIGTITAPGGKFLGTP